MVLVRSVDPFASTQGLAWQLLTCLSVSHPHRDVGVVARRKEGAGLAARGHGNNDGKGAVEATQEQNQQPKMKSD